MEDRGSGLDVVSPAHPGSRAVAIVRPGGFVPVVRRVAEADQDGYRALDGKRPRTLLGHGLEKQRQSGRLGVRAFEGIGQIDVRAPGRQCRVPVAQGATDPQFAHGVRTDQKFEAVEPFRQRRRLSRNRARTLFGFDPAQGVLDDAKQIGSGSRGGVEGDDAGVGETEGFAKAIRQ